MDKYSWVPLQRVPIKLDIAYITAMAGAEYESDIESTKDTP